MTGVQTCALPISQFNREGGKSTKPTIHDLEGSGQLEKDASLIFLLELEEAEFADHDGQKFVDAIIRHEKGRNTGKGKTHGRFYGRRITFDFV